MIIASRSSARSKQRLGFTIVELLVAIAILVVLAVIGFSVVGSSMKKARSLSCIQNLKDWSVNFASVAADNNGRLPTPKNWAAISNKPYTPDDDNPGRSPFADRWDEDLNTSMAIQLEKRTCPCLQETIGPSGNTAPTYMMNWRISRPPTFLEASLNELDRPANQIVFIDGYHGAPLRLQSKSDIERFIIPAADAHGGSVNAIFADLHVEPLKPKDLEENWVRMITDTE